MPNKFIEFENHQLSKKESSFIKGGCCEDGDDPDPDSPVATASPTARTTNTETAAKKKSSTWGG